MNRLLQRSFPPGYDNKKELISTSIAFIFVIAISVIGFISSFSNERRMLYIRLGNELILNESKTMPDFVLLIANRFRPFPTIALMIFTFTAANHYIHHKVESNSLYLMKRLPTKLELHKRCLVMPLMYTLMLSIIAFILLLIFYTIYMKFTPSACLAPNQWEKLWRGFT